MYQVLRNGVLIREYEDVRDAEYYQWYRQVEDRMMNVYDVTWEVKKV